MNDREAGTSAVMDDPDVFLNHRGPDVKATFVAQLDDALRSAGFRPFLDARSLIKGNLAFKSIDYALEVARVHVAVVSKGYAESKYCLNELVVMMSSKKPVIPIFYDVEPIHLRWLEDGPFAAAFEKHKSKGRLKKVQEWTDALRALADITGFRLADYRSDEAKLTREVVNAVARLTPSNEPVEIEHYRVGLEGPANTCIQALEKMGAGTGMLCLVGMGGVGKSTLAREIYNHFVVQKKFRYMTFLELYRLSPSNVQVGPTWLRKLRKQLLWDLLRVQDKTPNYRSWFRKLSNRGSVFVVIDNVHNHSQFEELIPDTTLLGQGSRIIVTSRNQSALSSVARGTKHYWFHVTTLSSDDSCKLFNWHVFRTEEAPKDYKDLAKAVATACGGLPLALKVTGSSLSDKISDEDQETIWPEAIDALKGSPDVMSVLKWSYDCLSGSEKLMFLDITCLFYGGSASDALRFWESCKQCTVRCGMKTPFISLRNLIDKNLVKKDPCLSNLTTHDLLRDMGEYLGREQCHSWEGRTAEAIVANNRGNDKIRGLNLAGSQKQTFRAENFASMPNLHYLVLDECIVNGDFGYMSKELRWLQWRYMPLPHLPVGLDLCNLGILDLSSSTDLAALWSDSNVSLEACPNLLKLNLMKCTSIKKLSDFIGQSSRLQELNLMFCRNLKELPHSIGKLKALRYLDLSDCYKLEALPDTIGGLSNLLYLSLSRCVSISELPKSIGLLSSLRNLHVDVRMKYQKTSGGIGEALTSLKNLKMHNCDGLETSLDWGALKSLEHLGMFNSAFNKLPESIGLVTRLEKLTLVCCKRLHTLPKSIGDLKMLRDLNVTHCHSLETLPTTLGGLTNLTDLSLNGCTSIKSLPDSIGLLLQLKTLCIVSCKNLQKLPISIRELKSLRLFILEDCGSIEALGALIALQGLEIWGCTSITKLPISMKLVSCLRVQKIEIDPWLDSIFEDLENDLQGDVLERNDCGYLEAYQSIESGVIRLQRFHTVGIPSNDLCQHYHVT